LCEAELKGVNPPVPKPKLLLADDSITIQKVVNLTFADQGMDVYPFSDGDKAIELYDEIKPDIVLADVHMPGINGYQLCELLRSDDGSKDIPVILLVGSFEPFDTAEAERVGASAYLTKPFRSIAELISTVEGLLPKPNLNELSPDMAESAENIGKEESGPETSDIDQLYESSFMETVELPKNGGRQIEFAADGIDDEMIQTSYAQADTEPVFDEPVYAADIVDEPVHQMSGSDHSREDGYGQPGEITDQRQPEERAEYLVDDANTVDTTNERPSPDEYEETSVHETGPNANDLNTSAELRAVSKYTTEPDIHFEEKTPALITPESDDHPKQGTVPDVEPAASSRDPFASIAAEPPTNSADYSADTIKFAFDDIDLLELPGLPTDKSVVSSTPPSAAAKETEVVSLSPELIELIVQKVIERIGRDK